VNITTAATVTLYISGIATTGGSFSLNTKRAFYCVCITPTLFYATV
jgi:hypothetical protein